ncbi:hypothetical protein [Salinimicrobium flavum]|uniref:Lipoprotein n=1 Tax=Salinimicrobium flavum TaxID=1737065 RepID=A0ABW5IXQ9_9FLAO
MSFKKFLIVLILIIPFYGCEEDKDPITLEETEIQYNILESGSFRVSDDNTINEQYLVFKNQEEWSVFLSLMEFKSPEKGKEFENLDFNFTDKTLLIITSEYDYTCCKEIKINKVYRNQGQIHVTFEVDPSTEAEQITSQSYLLFEVNKA